MEAERARLETDVSGLIAEAIREREAERVRKLSEEGTPAGECLTWHTTAEEIARINAGEREALDAFYSSRIITGICKPARGRSSAACPISALSYRKKI